MFFQLLRLASSAHSQHIKLEFKKAEQTWRRRVYSAMASELTPPRSAASASTAASSLCGTAK